MKVDAYETDSGGVFVGMTFANANEASIFQRLMQANIDVPNCCERGGRMTREECDALSFMMGDVHDRMYGVIWRLKNELHQS